MSNKTIVTIITLILLFSATLTPYKTYAITEANIILNCDKAEYKIGDTVKVSVKSESEVNIFGIQFEVKYDPTVFKLVGNGITADGKYTTFAGVIVDQVNGSLKYPLINYTSDKASPSMDIAQISFQTLKAGTSEIDISGIKAVNDESNIVSYNTNNHIFTTISSGTTSGGSSSSGGGGSSGGSSSTIVGTQGTTVETQINAKRLAGVNRIDTSVAVAKEIYYDKGPDSVVLATANDFADALAGSGLAYKYNGPLLLVGKTVSDSQVVLDYINTNLSKDKKIYILGGNAVVSSEISDYLTTQGYAIIRFGGQDRYETNQKIIDKLGITKGTSLVMATGEGFADALSISSIADIKGFPILLTGKDNLSASASQYITSLEPTTIYLVGGTGVLSTNIEDQIKKLNGSITIVRLGGKDRYETSRLIEDYFKLNSTTITVATGIDFPDALSGSVLAARKNSAILLLDNKDVTSQRMLITKEKISDIIILGGESVISKDIEIQLSEK